MSQAMARRKKVFTAMRMPLLATVVSANINAVWTLGVGDFGFVSTPFGVRLALGELLSPLVLDYSHQLLWFSCYDVFEGQW